MRTLRKVLETVVKLPSKVVIQLATSSARVLVIFPGALGDLVCAGPALDAIARANPGAKIELMAKPELARFAAGRFRIARGHSIDRSEVAALFSGETAEAREFFSQFRRLYSYLAYDDSGFRDRLERYAPGRTTCLPFRPPGAGHVAAEYLKMIDKDADVSTFRIVVAADDLNAAASALRFAGIGPDEPFVAIFPGSGSRAKNWPIGNYLNLATSMPDGTRPVFILGPAEEDLALIMSGLGLPLLSGLELPVVAGIARMAAAFVGNDSGVSHLAAAVGTPGVAIFGPTSPDRWRPIGEVTIVAHQSLESTTTDDIASALRERLQRSERFQTRVKE
ncbi:MAG TPA: glycosyltransferase family 9 protein [Candidatus Binataceae bacterium]|nr:glycosyltransferase family 9 protein [Candidatus Binataceae bacterium]